MVDTIVHSGVVVTVDDDRRVIDDGAVAIDGEEIVDVGTTDEVTSAHDSDRSIDASDHVVMPGLISSHVHVSDILLRGGIATDRDHYDWLFNCKFPGVYHMNAEEHAIASALYCREALSSGVTTFVENAVGSGGGYSRDIVEAKLDVYEAAGVRNVYAQSFVDREMDPEVEEFVELITSQEPDINHGEKEVVETEAALDDLDSLIEDYHGTANGRQHVWPAPVSPRSTSKEGLVGSYELAEKHDVMTTTHSSETAHDNAAVGGDHLSMVEYLHEIDYLGERALLGHCVHLSNADIRHIRNTGTKVAHNPLTNLALAAGYAPVPELLNYGVTVGLGTDNTSASDTINGINDLRFAAMVHKAAQQDASVMTAEKALEMATIDNARAIGMEDEIGSIEPGKKADLIALDLDHDHLTPHPDVVSAVVYQAQGFEVDTVICNGSLVVEDGEVPGVSERFPDLREQAMAATDDIVERAGMSHLRDRPWSSIPPR